MTYNLVQTISLPAFSTCSKSGKPGRDKRKYAEIIATFDTETSSIRINEKPVAFMYHWQFYAAGQVVLGRTWAEFRTLLNSLKRQLGGNILAIYVHNLAFDFSHMCHIFDFDKVFCTRARNPIKATLRDYPIEFRDSLILSGMPLAKLPTTTKKLAGDLDYSKIRHAKTILTQQEIQYCINDVVVLAEYIQSKLCDDNLATIPLTRTGYVRRDVRQTMQTAKVMPRHMTMTPGVYEQLQQAYAGGFTHASFIASGRTFERVRSLDITSSYPTALVAEFYPMGVFKPYNPQTQTEVDNALKSFACCFVASFQNIRAKDDAFEHIISKSKCTKLIGEIVDNGRIVSADFLQITINEIDFFDILEFYDADNINISNMLIAPKGRLPAPLVERILHYYAQKTTLKGKKGPLPDGSDAETMYSKYKEFVNAIYGCMVTSPVKPEITFENGEWKTYNVTLASALQELNTSRSRWNYYAWGIWCTSYSRHNLFTMMRACGEDYLYSDTDSLKILNYDKHKDQFDHYNQLIQARLNQACVDLGINTALVAPCQDKTNPDGTISKIPCPLGVFTDEGEYERFKTLGAKRYIYEQDGELHTTVAGAPKKAFAKYLSSLPGDPFENFTNGLTVPAEHSDKKLHQYQPEDWTGEVTDYTGKTIIVETYKDACHVSPTTVSINMAEEYALFLASIGEIEDVIFEVKD